MLGELSPRVVEEFQRCGFCRVGRIEPMLIQAVRTQLDELPHLANMADEPALDVREGLVFQIYDVPNRPPPLGALPEHPLLKGCTQSLLGEPATVAWSLLLNKSHEDSSNWSVPWHQDTSIYVKALPEHVVGELRGGYATFRPTDNSAGHLVVARVALDADVITTGCLFVVPGTHTLGNQWPNGGEAFVAERGSAIELAAGEIVFFNPLLMHRAGYCVEPAQRRIAHVYYRPTSMRLPGRAEWIDWRAISA